MTARRFLVTYKVGNSTGTTSLMLYGGTDSEAREELYRRCTIPRHLDIIILRIVPA